MNRELVWKVGGQQGEGIDSTGEIFATTLSRKGYYIASNKHFASRIKGGYTHYQVRVCVEPVTYHGDKTDFLLALDQETEEFNLPLMSSEGVILRDGKEESYEKRQGIHIITLPLAQLAEDVGGKIVRNMVSLGASAALLGLGEDLFDSLVEERFSKKGDSVINMNKKAVRIGYLRGKAYVENGSVQPVVLPPATSTSPHTLMSANEAFSLGALAAGCRFLSSYPITPASEIMEWMRAELPKVGGTVVQAEDEIAGLIMAIGAAYSGVRAMTSTSGPGLSLKTEGLGLAGMSETPVVIVNSQRGGPSTGLPTKTEQGDLQTMLNAGHGEIPRIVLAPSTAEESFYMAIQAFNYAERFQCPVIVALDLSLSLNKQSVNKFDFSKCTIDRGKLLSSEEVAQNTERFFPRYQITDDGISPRVIPGQKGGVHTANSNEHSQTGHITEDPELRVKMMDKRLGKLAAITEAGYGVYGPKECDILLVGFGSNFGVIQEVKQELEKQGLAVNHAHVKRLAPFDTTLDEYLLAAKQVVVIENNWMGQLKRLIQMECHTGKRMESIRKYSGDPFTMGEILDQLQEILAANAREAV